MFRALSAAVVRAFVLVGALNLVAACSPTLNWRELTLQPTALKITLPCKPDSVQRKIEMLPGREVVVHAVGCEAGGATYAVLYADLNNAADLDLALDNWKKASVASIRGTVQHEEKAVPAGARVTRSSTLLVAQGTRPDGRPIQSQASYFEQGTMVFQAAIYGENITPERAQPFFAGLRFE